MEICLRYTLLLGILHFFIQERNCPGTSLVDRIPYEKVAEMLIRAVKAFLTNNKTLVLIKSCQY